MRIRKVARMAASAFVTLVVAAVATASFGLPLDMVASLWLITASFNIQRNMTRTTAQ